MRPEIDLAAFDYALPAERIAQHPLPERDASRMLVLDRDTGERHHAAVRDLADWLHAGDLLVVNTTRVLPARLRGHKASGGAVEALLLGRCADEPDRFRALVKSTGRLRTGLELTFGPAGARLAAELVERFDDGSVALTFAPGTDPYAVGETPLPQPGGLGLYSQIPASRQDQDSDSSNFARRNLGSAGH